MTEQQTTPSVSLPVLWTIHELLIETFGGMRGVTEHGFGKLEAALAAPDLSMFGEDLYPTLHDKAAALFHGIVRSHGFTDGNKRVALVSLIVYLQWHGTTLHATDDELYDLTMAAATTAKREDVAAWIAARSEQIRR
jgi:death-on-curing protein